MKLTESHIHTKMMRKKKGITENGAKGQSVMNVIKDIIFMYENVKMKLTGRYN